MGLVMTGYPVGVFKAIKVDCLFFARSPVMHARQRIFSKKKPLFLAWIYRPDVSGRHPADCVACQAPN